MKIYVIAHKKYEIITHDPYIPLQVGASNAKKRFKLPFLHDDIGDNISVKNKNYCELTGLYWIWKNTNDDIDGLVHYRRYFCKTLFNAKKTIVDESDVRKILSKHDIILPLKRTLWDSVEYDYSRCHCGEDYQTLRDIISEKCPEYLDAFDKVSEMHRMYCYNMMICRREVLNLYCEWLFGILFEAEKRINISDYNAVQQRIFGYMSERLLNVWVYKNKPSIKEMPVYQTEYNLNVEIKRCIYMIGRYIFHIDPYTFRNERKLKIISKQSK